MLGSVSDKELYIAGGDMTEPFGYSGNPQALEHA